MIKPSFLITLVIVGGILILAPIVSNYLHQANMVRLLEKPGVNNVNLTVGTLSTEYTFGCWLTGTTMIVVSVLLVLWSSRGSPIGASIEQLPSGTK